MARPLGMPFDEPHIIAGLRSVAVGGGGKIVADSSTLSDANFPTSNDSAKGGILRAAHMSTIWLGVEYTDGTPIPDGTEVKVEPLVLDTNGGTDQHWKRLLDGAGNPHSVVLTNAGYRELEVAGRTVFLRIDAVVGDIVANIAITGFSGEMFAS